MDCSDAKRRALLETIGEDLMPDDFSIIKFLLTGVVPYGKLQKCTTGAALLIAIGTNGSDEHIIEGLARAGRKDLASKYSEGCSHEGEPLDKKIITNLNDLKKTYLKEFRVILMCIADELTDGEDLQKLKSITTDIPKRALGNANTVLDFLNLLIQEKKLEPHTLDTALLDPLQHLRITNWMKKHSEKISDFKERLALRAAEESEGSRGSPVTENAPELAETQDSQSSEDGNESQDQPPEKEQKVAEVEHSPKSEEEKKIPEQSPENVTQKAETEVSKNCKEKRESQEQPPEKGQNGSDTEEERGSRSDPDKEKEQKVAEVEHSPKSEEEKKIPEQSPENVTQKAETEDSKNCKEKRESQEQPPEKGQNGSDTEEERGSMRDPDKEKEQKVAEVEHSPKSEEEKKIPEQSPENVTQKAETEDSKNCKEKRESQEQPPEKGQNGSDTEEERGSRTDLDEAEDVVPEHSYADRARSDTAFDHINMMGFIDRKHKFSSWPNRSSMKVPDTTPEHYKVYRPVENVRLGEYKMTRTPRGKAVIFNIENFRKSQNHATDEPIKDRTGSSIDADGLVKVFNHLHFDVERFDDFSFNEINGRLRNLGEETDHDNVDCIAIFILTHGQNGKLLDANGSAFELALFRKYFHASKCVTLAGKPKMFFIQACQGPACQGRYNHLEKDTVTVKTSPPPPTTTQPLEKQHPDEADFLICNSTPPGYVSYRDMNKGSWFISTFIETLERDGNSFDLMEILARTNLVLGDKTGSIDGIPCAQIASITTTLRRKLFLRTIPSN